MNNTKLTHSSNYITSDIYQSIKTTHSICTKRKFSFALGAPMGGTAPLPPLVYTLVNKSSELYRKHGILKNCSTFKYIYDLML